MHGSHAIDRWEPESPMPRAATSRLRTAGALRSLHAVHNAVPNTGQGSNEPSVKLFDCKLWQAEDAVIAGHPEPLLVVLQNLVNDILPQPVSGCVRGEFPAFVPRQPALGSQPECAFGILPNRIDRVVCQAIRGRVSSKLTIVIATESVVCRYPQITVVILRDAANELAQEAILHGERCQRSVAITPKPANTAANPHVAVAVTKNRSDRVTKRKAVHALERIRFSFFAQHTQHGRAASADPNVSVAVLPDGPNEVAGQSVFGGVGDELPVSIPTQATAISTDPDSSVTRLENALRYVIRQAFLRRIDAEFCVPQPSQSSAPGADPQATFTVLVKCIGQIVRQSVGPR